jgi:hypothetical protein
MLGRSRRGIIAKVVAKADDVEVRCEACAGYGVGSAMRVTALRQPAKRRLTAQDVEKISVDRLYGNWK